MSIVHALCCTLSLLLLLECPLPLSSSMSWLQSFKDRLQLPLAAAGLGLAPAGSDAGSSLRSAPTVGGASRSGSIWRWATGKAR